ncbi:hypothetical protein AArcCO_0871 [Halalkaliarchaeum sp. AArc-CO]|nr:hypothetical protein AArcCO_0871 [Halalkaliarchaeum sp. AArc-CO]
MIGHRFLSPFPMADGDSMATYGCVRRSIRVRENFVGPRVSSPIAVVEKTGPGPHGTQLLAHKLV